MYRSYKPANDLLSYIECYWSWEIQPGSEQLDDILPDAAPELIVHLKSCPFVRDKQGQWTEQPKSFIYCAAHKALTLSIRAPMQVFAIRFRPWGVSRFCSFPMPRVLDQAVLPGEVFNSWGEELVRGIISGTSDTERRLLADHHLVKQLQSPSRTEQRLQMLLEATNGGTSTATEMARKLSISGRSFRRLWGSVVGIEPRKFIQLMRFHQALEKIDAGEPLKHVAADCGYSDQAHMARQIKSITGLPPSSLRRRLGNSVYQDLYASRPGAPWRRAVSDS